MSKNTSDKPKSNKKDSVRLIAILGIVVFLSVLTISSTLNRKRLEKEIDGMLDYLKTQCISYDEVTASDKSKSLMWLSDEVAEIARDIARDNAEVDEAYLNDHADGQRISGVIVTDENNNILYEYNKTNKNFEFLQSIINSKTIKDVGKYRSKIAVERVIIDDNMYDIAAVSREDSPGTVIGYYYQNIISVHSKDTAVENLLKVYNVDMNGMLIITDGEKVYSSNDDNINDKNVNINVSKT